MCIRDRVDGYSLDAQRDKLRKYAAYEDMIVAGEYSDEGFSGKKMCIRDSTYSAPSVQTRSTRSPRVMVRPRFSTSRRKMCIRDRMWDWGW